MKTIKTIALMMAVITLLFVFASCNKPAEDNRPSITVSIWCEKEDTTPILINDAFVYKYDEGTVPTPTKVLEALAAEREMPITFSSLGSLESLNNVKVKSSMDANGDYVGTYWAWTVNGAEIKDAMAHTYDKLKDGDALKFFIAPYFTENTGVVETTAAAE